MPVSTDDRAAGEPGDLALVAARFGVALRAAGVPADPGRCERFARAVTVARPATLPGLYLCALATLVASQDHIETLKRVFWDMFGGPEDLAPIGGDPQAGLPGGHPRTSQAADLLRDAAEAARTHAGPAQPERPGPARLGPEPTADGDGDQPPASGTHLVPLDEPAPEGEDAQAARHTLASAAERLASTDFAELTPAELLLLSGLMRKLTLAVLCDISGSMEPYARAMLQLLYCAAGGADAEVFTFATRLTRLTGTLARTRPEVALQQAGQAAPDWLGGTRIGESLAEFNDSFGRRGMARGAVVVIISDGWDTGDPDVLRREMERLSRVAHRIVWVNPRTQSPEYQPLAGGMAAAWPYCDAVVSAHSLNALDELTAALAHPGHRG